MSTLLYELDGDASHQWLLCIMAPCSLKRDIAVQECPRFNDMLAQLLLF